MGDSCQKFRIYATFVFFFFLIVILAAIWFITFPASAWEGTPNYFQMYLEFIITKPMEAFFTVATGPGGTVSWVFIPTYALIVIHVVLYFFGKHKGIEYTIVTRPYLVYLILLTLFAISFQNASQHYGWYWNPELDAPGYVDTWTHITSPWLLGALIIPFGLERYLGWDKNSRWLFIFFVLAIIALGWEIGETIDVQLRPSSTYFNYPMDSLKDIIMGVGIGGLLTSWIYELIVIDRRLKVKILE